MNSNSLILSGIKVLDFTRAMSGPFATMVLGDLGADIIKVEPPEGDESRSWKPPDINGLSSYFISINRNKRSIVVDLKNEKGKEIIHKIAKKVDVVIENFKPGTANKLGIDYKTISSINPSIIYVSLSAYGQTGPWKDKPGYDLTVMATSGLLSLNGEKDRPPVKYGVPIVDITSGLYAVISILSALYYREKTGIGQYIDLSMYDAQLQILSHQALSYLTTGKNPERLGSAHPNIAPYQVFKAKDGYVVIAVGNDNQWKRMCEVLNMNYLLNDPRFKTNPDRVRNRDALVLEMEKVLENISVKEIIDKLESVGVPVAPVNSVAEALNNEQTKSREMVVEVEHKKIGKIKVPGTPFKFTITPGKIRYPPPLLGENTTEILKEFGFSDGEINDLLKNKVIYENK
ncbi:putative acyl-CoA transferase/carnitine dehydratase [Caldisphaera lagunensis DSM 15908]|uniref:Putative acyl-CoA transferase/carnitine dehydratase n=1 Tax=Caldisphaera lagunensis (strain DSM 15908 / JCM 11604 / ANMR 0165 / IC-154) TaxID=1056495 RepID=L0A8X5_CALLD|nr:CoA transferase [Caldisphaera lagunensis]AFZ69874.1 putative acyl-CoA transferase/carnitine dehydratase [Caldisphaera lagunensis DSM 15908]